MHHELVVVLGGAAVALLTQLAKYIRDKCKCDFIDAKVLAALIAIAGGASYAAFTKLAPESWLEEITQFGALSFSGAVALYEVYKSLIENPLTEKNTTPAQKSDHESLLTKLIETERQARALSLSFESFELPSITRGQRTQKDLFEHIVSLEKRVSEEHQLRGNSSPLILGEK